MRHTLARRTAAPNSKLVRRPRRPGPSVLSQARSDHFTKWTVKTVMEALDAHEQGDFSRSAMLVDAMGRDDRISGVTDTRINAILSNNGPAFSIEPPDGKDDKLAKEVSGWWFEVVPDDCLRTMAGDMLMMGFSLWRIHWAFVDGWFRPVRLEHWLAQNVRHDEEQGAYFARIEEGEERVDEGDLNWLLIRPGAERSWMAGAVRALGLAFLMRTFTFRDWTRFNERHGLPIITVEEPAGGDENKKKEFYQSIQRMGSGGIIKLPQNATGTAGYKLGIVEAKDQAHASFTQFRQDLDTGIAVKMLGQNLTTEVKGGSYAAATAHEQVRQDFLEADTEILTTSLRAGILVPVILLNIATATLEDVPWPRFNTAAPIDRKAAAEAAKAGGDAIVVLRKTKMPIDFAKLCERLDLPIIEGQDPNAAEAMDPDPVPGLPTGDIDPKKTPAKGHMGVRLASGARLSDNAGFVNGQLYADDLVDAHRKAAGAAQSEFINELVRICQTGADYQSIRDLVLRHYADRAQPLVVRDMIEQVLVLSQLAGRHAVDEDA